MTATAPHIFLVEALTVFLLVFTVVATTTDAHVPAKVAPPAIGFALAVGVLLGGPVSGGAGNPARALGPMLVAGTYQDIIYILAPLAAGSLAAVLYGRVVAAAVAPQTTPAAAPQIPAKTLGVERAARPGRVRRDGHLARPVADGP